MQQCSVGANSSDLILNWMVAVKEEWNVSPPARYLNSLLFGLSNAIAKANPKSIVGEECDTSVGQEKKGCALIGQAF